MRRALLASVLAGCLLAMPAFSSAYAQSDFYKGKTVSIVMGAKSGSLAVSGQIVAQFLGKHIPGNPNVIFVSMPGGAHMGATNHVYNVAEADGLTILGANANVAVSQLAKVEQVRFDMRKFEWLGSSGSDGAMFSIRADLPYKTAKEVLDSGKELVVGTTGPGSNAHDMPLLLKEFAGFKLKLVSGYAANSDILLAVERKESDGWSALATTIKNGIDRGAVRAIIRTRATVKGFEHLPIDESLTNDPIGKSLMAIRGIPLQIGRAFGVRPGTPKDRVEMLRTAFAKTMADPELKAAMEKAKIDAAYISGQDVAKNFDEMFNQSPQVMEAMGKYIKPGD